MKLVVVYGPPGVGKLTVARALAKKTGYKVLHNHLTIELLCSLFDWGSAPFNRLIKKYRFELLETAAKENLRGVITTFVYGAEVDDEEIRELLRRMKRHRVLVYFVQLSCSQKELERRISGSSRKAFTKIRRVYDLRRLMKKFNVVSTVRFGKNLALDTTHHPPAQTAQKIIHHFDL